jgi:hypothetical protein
MFLALSAHHQGEHLSVLYKTITKQNVVICVFYILHLYFIFIFCIYILHLYFTFIFYIYILHLYFTFMFYIYILHLYFTFIFYIYILQLYFTFIFYIYILHFNFQCKHHTNITSRSTCASDHVLSCNCFIQYRQVFSLLMGRKGQKHVGVERF